MKDAPSDVTSTIPVMVGSSLCLLDTTLDSIGCRGGNRVLIAREGEYLVGPPAIEAAEGVLYLRIVVGSAAGNRGRESLLASVELRLVKP